MRRTVSIKFQNGLNKEIAERDILHELKSEYLFEESDQPDFILFGPYGNDIPAPGNYIRIGYFCENIKPDLSICEWAFGVPREEEVNDQRYKRIQWHGLDPNVLIKPGDYNAEQIFDQKKYFCNFLYSYPVPYREQFFKQLSKYKKVDAPGRSMNNMESIDKLDPGELWHRKRQFLSQYKFTIAFENYTSAGYQTEKLYDAMRANSIPIYCGDPFIGQIFNTQSLINVTSLVKPTGTALVNWLKKKSLADFTDIRPSFYTSPYYRFKRKLKSIGRYSKMKLQFQNFDFAPVIERIIELDQDKNKYIQMLKQPWFKNNQPPMGASLKDRWQLIFNQRKI